MERVQKRVTEIPTLSNLLYEKRLQQLYMMSLQKLRITDLIDVFLNLK